MAGTAGRWDLSVDEVHSFYVEAAGPPVLVHNCPSNFGKAAKRTIWGENAAAHGGVNVCETCGVQVSKPLKSVAGVTPPANDGQVDHIFPKAKGGEGVVSNGQLLCRACNREKSDKWP